MPPMPRGSRSRMSCPARSRWPSTTGRSFVTRSSARVPSWSAHPWRWPSVAGPSRSRSCSTSTRGCGDARSTRATSTARFRTFPASSSRPDRCGAWQRGVLLGCSEPEEERCSTHRWCVPCRPSRRGAALSDLVVVLTALNLEYAAVREHLADVELRRHGAGTRFEIGHVPESRCRVALGLTGVGNQSAAVLAERAIQSFEPAAVVFTGIAGALWDGISLGDVVVADRVYAYQGGTSED